MFPSTSVAIWGPSRRGPATAIKLGGWWTSRRIDARSLLCRLVRLIQLCIVAGITAGMAVNARPVVRMDRQGSMARTSCSKCWCTIQNKRRHMRRRAFCNRGCNSPEVRSREHRAQLWGNRERPRSATSVVGKAVVQLPEVPGPKATGPSPLAKQSRIINAILLS
jgi:hypothetical protein